MNLPSFSPVRERLSWAPKAASIFSLGVGKRAPATSPKYSVRSTSKNLESASGGLRVALPNP